MTGFLNGRSNIILNQTIEELISSIPLSSDIEGNPSILTIAMAKLGSTNPEV